MTTSKTSKYTYEIFRVATDFAAVLASGETITDLSVVAYTSSEESDTDGVVVEGSEVTAGSIGSVMIQDGDTAHSPYRLSFHITTSIGHKWQHDVRLTVNPG